MRDARTRLIAAALPAVGETVRIGGEEAAHARARRLAPSETVVLIDGSGREAIAEVVRAMRGEVLVRVTEIRRETARAEKTSLYVAGLRPERLAWTVQKATELDVDRVVVVESGRTQSFRADASVSRLDRVAREASKQCGRSDWPSISGPVPIARALAEEGSEHRFFLDFDGDRFPRRLAKGSSALLVGPEGGWTDDERSVAVRRGWKVVSLPAGRLRAETAAIAGLVLLSAARERKTR
ncbi:MAG TPA: RsmE family RNA methyltransferase [Thermoanaerobaculia bacterium]